MKPESMLKIACCALLAVAGFSVQAAELPDGFRLEPIVTGLTAPSAIAMAPDGRVFVGERATGDLRVVKGGVLAPGAVCHVDVETTGEAGLLGVAVHPRFNENGWVYLYYTDLASGANRVSRVTITDASCGGATTILNLGAGPSFERNGGGIAFGPDGKLYVATGDMESPGNGQLPGVLQAKILRVNDDGTAPADNPTPGDPVYAIGVRDGNGIAILETGQVYATDTGDAYDLTDDEINAVPAGGNLGWDIVSGDSGGTYDDPLMSWPSTGLVGPAGLALYAAEAFPVLDGSGTDILANGVDDDEDRFGADGLPGVARVDDNGEAYCVGGFFNGLMCPDGAPDSYCKPRDLNGDSSPDENVFCYPYDEPAEYCPSGAAYGDDACGSDGTDEVDESFLHNLFSISSSDDRIMRVVTDPASPDTLDSEGTFFDPSYWADCPTGWTALAGGYDGWLYLTAANGGAAGAGGLYRVIYDAAPGPREVSPSGSPFPLTMTKGAGDDAFVLSWEDLRTDAMQPRNSGSTPQAPVREFTIWRGDLGNFYSHAPVGGLDAVEGTAVNGALRSAELTDSGGSAYYLVSGRGDNLEGSLGTASDGVTERPGYAVTDLCDTLGTHVPPDASFLCGADFTLPDENGVERSLSDYRGHPIMLDLSAVWCGPCNTEADEMEQELQQVYRDLGAVILTALVDDNVASSQEPDGRPAPGDCLAWSNRTGTVNDHTFTCVADGNQGDYGPQAAWPVYGTGYLPTNVVLDQGFRVVYSGAGWYGVAPPHPKDDIKAVLDTLLTNENSCLK